MPFALFKARPLPPLATTKSFSRKLSVIEYYHASVGISGKTVEIPRENGIILEGDGQLDIAQWRQALDAAAKANPGARLRLSGDCWWARWDSDGPMPGLRVIEDCAWDGYSERGVEVLYATKLDLRSGPTTELVVIPRPGNRTTLVLRSHHAVMDGMGSVHFYHEMFRALRGEPLVGTNGTFADVELMLSTGVSRSTSRHVKTESVTGLPAGTEVGDVWRRVQLGKPIKNQMARVAEAIAEFMHQRSDLPALIGIPVDMRRHAPGLRSTANFANMLLVQIRKGEVAEHFRLRLKEMLEHKMETYYPRILGIFKLFPLAWLDKMMGRTSKNYLKRKAMETVALSNLGKFDPAPMIAPDFAPTSLLGIPIRGSACIGLVCIGDQVEMTVGLTRERASEGRMDALIGYLQKRLAE